ncbi:MAG: hypothetical protein QNJ97_16270 [Myxococcota bacterium]|nr:hypothetical protein [Myxococcota bacterium]
MKRFTSILIALFAITMAVSACHNTEDANEKIEECLEEAYGAEEAEAVLAEWELTCEDGEDDCDDCVDCVMDAECDDLLDGTCDETCE